MQVGSTMQDNLGFASLSGESHEIQDNLEYTSLTGGSQEAKSTRQLGVASLSGMAECSISHLNFTHLIHNTPQL